MTTAAAPREGDWGQLPPPIQRLADLGTSEGDSEDVRLRKRVLNLAAALIFSIAPVWVIIYSLLGLWLPAAIPLAYILASAALIFAHSRTRLYRAFRGSQLTMMLVFPVCLQASLGGFANGSAVALWSLTAPLAAVFFVGVRHAVPWFAAFAALIAASGALDPLLSEGAPHIPAGVIIGFFALNFLAVSATVFILLQYFVRAREAEQARSERLLLNVLPESVAGRLKRSEGVIADGFPEATVLFADIVDFTPLAERMDPEAVVRLLDRVFTRWDELVGRHGLEKIKTIGDAYMAVGGVPDPRPDHAAAVARMALEMSAGLPPERGARLQVRIGIDSGPVVAGVIGRSKFIYDLWGDTVNTASRMESTGEPGRIQVTERVRADLGPEFVLRRRGEVAVKGKRAMVTYFLEAAGSGKPTERRTPDR